MYSPVGGVKNMQTVSPLQKKKKKKEMFSLWHWIASDGKAPFLESELYSFISITPWSTLNQRVVPVRVSSMDQIDLFYSNLIEILDI